LAVDWVRHRLQGGDRVIRHQLIQGMIADSVVDIATTRAFVRQVAWEMDQEGNPHTLHAKVATAKVAATEAATRVLDRSVQMLGARGFLRSNPVERLSRDIRGDRFYFGTSELMRIAIAEHADKRGI